MRKAWLLTLAPVALVHACGGADDTIVDGGPNDATVDVPTIDAANDITASDTGPGDVVQGTDTGPGDASDAEANDTGSDASDAGTQYACAYPSQCVDGGDLDAAYPPDAGVVCCATVVTKGPSIFSCTLASVTTTCSTPASCPSSLDTTACGTSTFRGCDFTSECTEPSYDKCCRASSDAGAVQVCMSSAMITVLKATCLP